MPAPWKTSWERGKVTVKPPGTAGRKRRDVEVERKESLEAMKSYGEEGKDGEKPTRRSEDSKGDVGVWRKSCS